MVSHTGLDDLQHVGLRQIGGRPVHQRADMPLHRLLPIPQMQGGPLAAQCVHVLAERDRSGQHGCSCKDSFGIQPAILRLTKFSPLGTRIRQRHGGVFADGKLALAAFRHVAEGPATAAALDLELQPLTVTVFAALEVGYRLRRERVLEH